jgi:hypothetical protein
MQRSHLVTGDEGHYAGVVRGAPGRGGAGRRAAAFGTSSTPSSCIWAPWAAAPRPPGLLPRHPSALPLTTPLPRPPPKVMELESRGAKVIPVFAGGLDFSSPVKKFFYDPLGSGKAGVDCCVSLTGARGPPRRRAQGA